MNKKEKIEYYKIRLEHTLSHNQEATRLIYLVNAGILAFVSFLWEKIDSHHGIAPWLTLGALITLTVINHYHFLFIKRQNLWYKEIRDSYWRLIEPSKTKKEITEQTNSEFKRFFSSDLFANIHRVVFYGLLTVTVILAIYYTLPFLCPSFCQ